MRRILMILLAIALLTSIANAQTLLLTDIENHWGKEYIEPLVELEIINGYEDGTFRPENTITIGEVIKVLVLTQVEKDDIRAVKDDEHWAMPYVVKAQEKGIITKDEMNNEFSDFNAEANRGQVAKMISRFLINEATNIQDYEELIKDYDYIDSSLQGSILTTFANGIIQGYEDGRFIADNPIKRVELATMTMRYINPDLRKMPKRPIQVVEKGIDDVDQDIKELQELIPEGYKNHIQSSYSEGFTYGLTAEKLVEGVIENNSLLLNRNWSRADEESNKKLRDKLLPYYWGSGWGYANDVMTPIEFVDRWIDETSKWEIESEAEVICDKSLILTSEKSMGWSFVVRIRFIYYSHNNPENIIYELDLPEGTIIEMNQMYEADYLMEYAHPGVASGRVFDFEPWDWTLFYSNLIGDLRKIEQ